MIKPNWLDNREFYELMQAYRNAPMDQIKTLTAYEAVKQWLRENAPVQIELPDDTFEARLSRAEKVLSDLMLARSITPPTDLMKRLVEAQVGGCTCMTKSPDIQHHNSLCHYRLFQEAFVTLQEKTHEDH